MQSEPGITDDDRVAGVGPAAVSYNDIAVLGEDIDNLSFSFVTPLESDDAMIHVYLSFNLDFNEGHALMAFN